MILWPTQTPTLIHGLVNLRPLEEADIANIFISCQDPNIPRFTRVPSNYTIDQAEAFVHKTSPKSFKERSGLIFAIDYRDGIEKQFAGVISFHSINLQDHVAELGYWIDADMRGKGIGTAAANLLTNYGFESMRFERIHAYVDIQNSPSRKLLLSAGFTFEGILRKFSSREDGSQVDMALYSMIRDDWQEGREHPL